MHRIYFALYARSYFLGTITHISQALIPCPDGNIRGTMGSPHRACWGVSQFPLIGGQSYQVPKQILERCHGATISCGKTGNDVCVDGEVVVVVVVVAVAVVLLFLLLLVLLVVVEITIPAISSTSEIFFLKGINPWFSGGYRLLI